MNRALIGLLLSLVGLASALIIANTTISQQQIYKAMNMSFDMDTKIEVYPGETKTIEGRLLNTGWLWLYNVTIKAENLTYEHTITPNNIPVLPIKYYWVDGRAFRTPQNFSITIKIPENLTAGEKEFFLTANGSFRIYLPMDMKYLHYPMQIKQRVVLKVVPTPSIEIKDITFPEVVIANKTFEISMLVINNGDIGTTANISIDLPKDWQVDSKTKSIRIEARENKTLNFSVTPSNSSGQVSLYLLYPVRQKIINITKTGPFLVPQLEEVVEKPVPGLIERIVSFIKSLPPILLLIIVILSAVIIWNLAGVIRFYRRRKKPEKPG
ncbi:MAG: hypothetical protein QXQ18_01030 [Candidatus Aenigmatarchaeota archaeon]